MELAELSSRAIKHYLIQNGSYCLEGLKRDLR